MPAPPARHVTGRAAAADVVESPAVLAARLRHRAGRAFASEPGGRKQWCVVHVDDVRAAARHLDTLRAIHEVAKR